MSRTKLGRMAIDLNDDFRVKLADAVREKFGIEVETYYDFFGSGRMVTRRVDDEVLTPEQYAWLKAYSDGYGQAMEMVREADYR